MPPPERTLCRIPVPTGCVADSVGDLADGGRHSPPVRSRLSERGVTSIEYALIASLIAVAILAGVGALGTQLEALYLRVCNAVVGAIGGGSC